MMVDWLAYSIVGLYAAFLLFIALYSVVQGNLVYNYVRGKKSPSEATELRSGDWPMVTVQLPIYNEQYVVERIIEAVAAFDYPSDKLEIQILDDSDDETVQIIDDVVQRLNMPNITVVRRPNREGFKAGALVYATERCSGEFIAIFDADFVPNPDFLKQTIVHFNAPNVGVVQTKWQHINRDYSMLTRLQAFGLDAHFSVEQGGRNLGGHFINFNGTAGVWRKTCIADAGGWESDTLTEDLDLSYRAQLKKWKFKFVEHVGAPAELPAVMHALKAQQFRWTKGAAECTRKNLGRVWRSSAVNMTTKIHALFHLMNSFLFICIFGTALLSVPMLFVKHDFSELAPLFKLGSIFLLSLISLSAFYYHSNKNNYPTTGEALKHFIVDYPLFLSVSMGLSLHNAIAVMEGYLGKKSPFIRTPKYKLESPEDSLEGNTYAQSRLTIFNLLEGVLGLYFLFGIMLAFKFGDFALLPFHLMLVIGFSVVFYYTVKQTKSFSKKKI